MQLTVKLPTFRTNDWGNLSQHGEIILDTAVGQSPSASYDALKPQIADLLSKLQAENQIVFDIQLADAELSRKRRELNDLSKKIKLANNQLTRLTTFLSSLGIKAEGVQLTIDVNSLAGLAADPVLAQVVEYAQEDDTDPIPFNDGGGEHEF
jgi:hypothetical protein